MPSVVHVVQGLPRFRGNGAPNLTFGPVRTRLEVRRQSVTTPAGQGPDRLLDAGEVAKLLNVPATWVAEAARAGRIPHVRLGRYVRFEHLAVLEWVAQNRRVSRSDLLRRRSLSVG